MKIAIIGTGIAGNAAAWLLHSHHDITVYEKSSCIGGHSNTVSLTGHPDIDTGFIVYNEWTYPNLIALFDHLNVKTEKTDMSFGVSLDEGQLEYSGDRLFIQKRNILNPRFYHMLLDIIRFYKQAPLALDRESEDISLGEYLREYNYSAAFINDHLYPMAAAIWSTSATDIKNFPFKSFVRFFVNHGLFLFKNRPQWWTVTNGSRQYVDKLTDPYKDRIKTNCAVKAVIRKDKDIVVSTSEGLESFDQVIFACHSDQALSLIQNPSEEERKVLQSFPYAENIAFLHQDESLMPKRSGTWSSWNYLKTTHDNKVCLTYWMNRLQKFIGEDQNYFVTLNPSSPPDPEKTLKQITYEHPQFTLEALKGWKNLKDIQGKAGIWYCGAWCGYGFHEDGLSAGLAVAEAIGPEKRPWKVKEEKSPAGKHVTPV